MALNEKQERFCQEYIKDLNGTAAYMRVYPKSSERAARASASELLAKPNVQQRIFELKESRMKKAKISQEAVVKRLADIAFAHIGLVCVWTDTGLDLKDRNDLTESELAAIDQIDISPVGDGDGGLLGYKKRVKMKDSLKALELLCRHLGILDGQGNNRGDSEAAAQRILDAIARVKGRSTDPTGSNKS